MKEFESMQPNRTELLDTLHTFVLGVEIGDVKKVSRLRFSLYTLFIQVITHVAPL